MIELAFWIVGVLILVVLILGAIAYVLGWVLLAGALMVGLLGDRHDRRPGIA